MKICMVGGGIPKRPLTSESSSTIIPVSSHVHTLAQQLCYLGHKVDVISVPAKEVDQQVYRLYGVGKFRSPGWDSPAWKRAFYNLWFGFISGLKLRKFHKQHKYDVITIFERPASLFFAALFSGKHMPPIIFHLGMPVSGFSENGSANDTDVASGTEEVPRPVLAVGDFMYSYALKKMTTVITSSNQVREYAEKKYRAGLSKIAVAPFASLENDLFRPGIDSSHIKKQLGLLDSESIILCLAGIAPFKNQLSLIKAIPKIIEEHPDARFLFIGTIYAPQYYKQIQEYVAENSLGKYVNLIGYIENYEDLPAYYNAADIYVLISFAEGLPKTPLEAMGCGKAVVLSAIPQNQELAKRGDELVFVDPLDIDAIAATINDLLDNPDKRAELGKNARRTVMEYYTPEAIAKRLLSIYEEAIEAKKNS